MSSYEVMAAVGNVAGIRGKVFSVAAYAPPNITPSVADDLIAFVSNVVAEGKRKYLNCSIIVGGDFNQ